MSTYVVPTRKSFFAEAISTIAQALFLAKNGDTIRVEPGCYQEDLTITKSVTLTGAGREEVSIKGSVVVSGGRCRISNLNVRGSAKHGISVVGRDTSATMSKVLVHEIGLNGINASSGATAELFGVEVFNTQYAAVSVREGASVTARDCRLHDTPSNAVYVASGGKINLERLEAFGCVGPAIFVGEYGSKCMVLRARVYRCEGDGIAVLDNAVATIVDSEFSDVKGTGISAGKGASVQVEATTFTNSTKPAIYVFSAGTSLRLQDSVLRDCTSNLILVENGASATVAGGELLGGVFPCVAATGAGSSVSLEDTALRHGDSAVFVTDHATANLTRCVITGFAKAACQAVKDAVLSITDSEISDAAAAVLVDSARGRLVRLAVNRMSTNGLWVDGGRLEVSEVRISGCGPTHSGVVVARGATLEAMELCVSDAGSGVSVIERGQAVIKGGEFRRIKDTAIGCLHAESSLNVTGVRIAEVKAVGLLLRDSAKGVLSELDIGECECAADFYCSGGIYVDNGADLTARHCRVHNCSGPAFKFKNAVARVENGEVWACADPVVDGDAEAIFDIVNLSVRDAQGAVTRIDRSGVKGAAMKFGPTTARQASTQPPKPPPLNPPPPAVSKTQPAPALSAMERLNAMIGLEEVKAEVTKLVNLVAVQSRRRERGLPIQPVSLHMVFTGNPGTGKTTVANLMGEALASLGLLAKGHVVLAERRDLVAGHIGHTAIKTKEKIDAADGGILFIDEAYTLAPGDAPSNDFGPEAIDTLLTEMESRRDRFAVIVAGYTSRMHRFIDANPGLKSRFTRYIHFADYLATDLAKIFLQLCSSNGFILSAATETRIREEVQRIYDRRSSDFGNARVIRNLFEQAIERQAGRLAADPAADVALLTPEDVSTPRRSVTDDLPAALADLDRLIGLQTVKAEIGQLVELVNARQRRKASGMPVAPMSLHMVFSGSPGTGKTTVARILGRILAALGLLERGEVIEVQRADLVAGYVGQTGPRVQQKVKEALGSILFIDEAYTLASRDGGQHDFGREAIETLLKEMEDRRDAFAVIAAGYTTEMKNFLASNPGLPSRFTRMIEFPDYEPDELTLIFAALCRQNGFELDEDARIAARENLQAMFDGRTATFGNGRDVRTLFERVVERQAMRLGGDLDADPARLTSEDMTLYHRGSAQSR